MSDMQGPGGLQDRLRLSDDGLAAAREALAELTDEGGVDYLSLFEHMLGGAGLREALGLPESAVDALYSQAFAQFNAGNIPAALKLFQSLTVLSPSEKDHWMGLGICLRIEGKDDGAGMAFDVAVELDGSSAALRFHRMELACRNGDWAAAKAESTAYHQAEDCPQKEILQPEVQRLDALLERKGR